MYKIRAWKYGTCATKDIIPYRTSIVSFQTKCQDELALGNFQGGVKVVIKRNEGIALRNSNTIKVPHSIYFGGGTIFKYIGDV